MNWMDYIIISVIAVAVLYGAARGFIRGIFGMAGLIVSFIVMKRYYPFVAGLLIKYTGLEDLILNFIHKNKVTETFAFSMPVDKGFNDLYQYITMVIINCIAMLAAFAAARVCMLLLENLLQGVFKLPVLSTLNHSGGAILGLAQAILIILFCYAIFVPLSSLEKFEFIRQAIAGSLLSKYFYQYNFVLGWALDTALDIFLK